MTRIMKLGILGIVLWFPAMAQDTLHLSLDQCLKSGLESGQSVLNAKLNREKVLYQKREALSSGLPHLEAYGTYDNYFKLPVTIVPGDFVGRPGESIPITLGTKHNMTGGVKATQLLYNQTYFTALKLANVSQDISQLSLEKARTDLVYELSQLYFLIKATDDQRNIYRDNAERLDRLIEIAGLQYDAGLVLKVDKERIKVERENLLTELSNLDNLYLHQVEMLKYTAGLDNNIEVVLTDSLQTSLLKDTDRKMTGPMERPELLLIRKNEDLALVNKKIVTSGYYPTLSLYGQYFYQGQLDHFDFFTPGDNKWFDAGVVGLSLTIPIFDGFEKSARVNQAKVDYLKASTDYSFTKRYFDLEYKDAVGQYNTSRVAVKRQHDNTGLAGEVYDQALLQYQQGTATLSDLLGAGNSLSNSELSLMNATLQLRNAELDLRKASGTLLTIENQ